MQESDADGAVTFTSIFPAAYSGRWPHIHFEVYPSLAAATRRPTSCAPRSSPCPRRPASSCTPPPATAPSVSNLAQTSLATDNVFSDGWSLQLATVTGDVDRRHDRHAQRPRLDPRLDAQLTTFGR